MSEELIDPPAPPAPAPETPPAPAPEPAEPPEQPPVEPEPSEYITIRVGNTTITSLPPAPPAPQDRRITRLAFLNRFTDAEAIAFDLASMGATPQAAAMRRYMNKVNAAMYINLDLPETRAGVEALEAGGLLAAGRAAAILDGEIAEAERFKD